MANKRDLVLNEYDITKFAYRELHNFCLQYAFKKQKLKDILSPFKSQIITGMPHGNEVGNPSESAAVKASALSSDIEMIEKCARKAGDKDYELLLLSVTQDVPWYYLRMLKGLETSEKKFNHKRRYFYYLLASEKNIL